MQSEAVDFTSGVATWRTGRNIRLVFDSGLFPVLYNYENMASSTKSEVHNVSRCTAVRVHGTQPQKNRHTYTLNTK